MRSVLLAVAAPLLAGLLASAPGGAEACGGSGSAQNTAGDPPAAPLPSAPRPPPLAESAEDDGPVTAGPMSADAALGLRLFEAGRLAEAAVLLDRVARGASGDDAGNRQIAQYHLGIALARLELHQASFAVFSAIAEDKAHLRHGAALPWLVELLPALADVNDVLDRLGAYATPAGRDLSADLAYLFGRYWFRRRAYDEAAKLLEEVDRKSRHYLEAQMFAGTAYALVVVTALVLPETRGRDLRRN